MKIIILCFFSFFSGMVNAGNVFKLAPDCQLMTSTESNEKSINLKKYQGQVLYVDFWASWCPPCLKSFPFMNEIEKQFKQQGLQVVAINMDDNLEDAQQFLDSNTVEFNIVYDNKTRDCAQAFEVKAMPSSYLIDKEGKIQYIHLGFKAGETEKINQMIAAFLKK